MNRLFKIKLIVFCYMFFCINLSFSDFRWGSGFNEGDINIQDYQIVGTDDNDRVQFDTNDDSVTDVTLKSDSITVNEVTYPGTDGTAGQSLFTDGLGNMSFSDPIGTISLPVIGTPTYSSLQDFVNSSSAGFTSGGTITDSGSGEIDVAAGTGYIKTTDADLGVLTAFDWSAETNLSLTDNNTNWIYIDYNAGSPQVGITTTLSNIDLHTEIIIGRVYRDSTTLHIVNTGQDIADYYRKDCYKDFEVNGFQRASGAVLGETGTRNVTVTASVLYCGHNRLTTSAIDTSGSDTFDVFNSGASTSPDSTGASQVDNTQYWNGAALATLTTNRYGTRFFYLDHEGDLFMMYGTSNAVSVAGALDEDIPAANNFLNNFSIYIGRIVIQKDAASFSVVTNPFLTPEEGTAVSDHGDLSGLGDDDHTQYLLADGSRSLSNSSTATLNIVSTGTNTDAVITLDTKTTDDKGFIWLDESDSRKMHILAGDSMAFAPNITCTQSGWVGFGTQTPLKRVSIQPGATGAKLSLYDLNDSNNMHGFGVSSTQLNYHVKGATSSHVFYAQGDSGDGTELARISGDPITLDITGKHRYSDPYFEDEMFVDLAPQWSVRNNTGSRGSGAGISAYDGAYEFTSGNQTNDEYSVDWNDIICFSPQFDPIFECTLRLVSTANIEVEFGFIDFYGNDYFKIFYDASASSNWQAAAGLGGVGTETDTTGITASSSKVVFKIESSNNGLSWEWFANGASQGTLSTYPPAADLQPYISVTTETTAAKDVEFYFVKIWQDRI